MKNRLNTHKTLIGILILGITALFLPIILLVGRDITNINSRAALPNQLEAEGGVLSSSGVIEQNDSNASGGKFIRFGTISSGPSVFIESNGQVVFEAENYDENLPRNGTSWEKSSSLTGASNNEYIISNPDNGISHDTNYITNSPETRYNIRFSNIGTYYVWVRGNGPDGGGDSAHIGLNGNQTSTSERFGLGATDTWNWNRWQMNTGNILTVNIATAGDYVLNLWMREDGSRIDKILLTTDSNFTPTELGPSESSKTSGGGITSTPSPTTGSTPQPTPPQLGELKAFPSAVGWGKNATGGRGGEVRKVTNLNNSGPGSLREAWEKPGKATIIFEVAGTITVSSAIKPTGDKTIAGETAFRNGGGGITIKRDGTYGDSAVSGNLNNSIVRYIRFRPGPTNGIGECCGDAFTVFPGPTKDIIIDHSSFSWGTDETVNFWEDHRYITFQNNIISEPLYFSTHMENGVFERHGFAFLSGGDLNDCSISPSHITFYNTLIAHSDGRNPRFAGGCAEHEMVNTILYNWGHFGLDIAGGAKRVNVINLYGINGNNTSSARYITNLDSNTRLYVKGIYDRKNNYGADGDWAAIGGAQSTPAPTSLQSTTAFNYPLKDYPKLSRNEILNLVTQNAGANLKKDAVDIRILNDVASGGSSGSMIDHPNEVGGWPSLSGMSSVPKDSDNDGMPDSYEDSVGLNKYNSSDGGADSGDGYTNLEKYLFTLTGDI